MTAKRGRQVATIAARAIAAEVVCLATATGLLAAIATSWADITGPAPAPESGVVVALGAVALAVVVLLAGVVLRAATPAIHELVTGRSQAPRRRVGGIERAVVGLVLGAGALAPQAAGAAVATTTLVAAAPTADAPVDPTYLADATPTPAPAPIRTHSPTAHPAAASAAAPTERHHVVQPGDTLWQVAADAVGPGADDAEVARAVNVLYAANQSAIGSDPDQIEVGTRLVLPTTIGAHR